MSLVARYVGNGREYHEGIPASDLDEERWATLDQEQQATVRSSPLYEMAPPKAAKAPAPKGGV